MILQPNIESIYQCLYDYARPKRCALIIKMFYDVVHLLEIDLLIENFLKNVEEFDSWWIPCWQNIITVEVTQTQTVMAVQ